MKFVCYDLMAVNTKRLNKEESNSPTQVQVMGGVVLDKYMSHIAFDAFHDLLDGKKLQEGLGVIVSRISNEKGEDEYKIESFLVDPDIVDEGQTLPSSISLVGPQLFLVKIGDINPFEMDTGDIKSNLLDLAELASNIVHEWKEDKKNKLTYQFLVEEALKNFLKEANMVSENSTVLDKHGNTVMGSSSGSSKLN